MNKKQQRQQKMLRQQEIVNAAKDAGRDLTAEEQTEFDSLQREIERLDGEIAAEEQQQRGMTPQPNDPPQNLANPEADTQRAIQEERARIRSITELCGEFGMEARSYIESGATLDSVREAALEHVRQHGAPISANGRVSITESAEDKFRAAAADAIVMRSGMELQNPADGARQMMGMTLRDLAIECLTNEGQSGLNRRSSDELYGMLQRQFYNPTAAFPAILDNAINKAFTNKLNAAKTAVTNVLGNIKQAFSDKLEAAKSVVTGALDKIKGAFNFKWSLPHLNLPHISVSGGQAPYGIAGKGSLPKFSIEWYKNGGIMTQPTAFGINPESGNLMAGGEAGPEAIVPLSQLWEKMTTILKGILAESQNGGAGNALSALVDKVGAAMQGSTQTPISGLLDRLSGGGNEPQPATANGAPINYAPVYNFNGAAPTKDDLVEAERMSQAEFNEMMEQWQRDNDRKRF